MFSLKSQTPILIFSLQIMFGELCPGSETSCGLDTPRASAEVKPFIFEDSPIIALTDVKIIDGTNRPPRSSQTLVIRHGKIAAIGDSNLPVPQGAKVFNLKGHTIIPGIVGMHEHLGYTHFVYDEDPKTGEVKALRRFHTQKSWSFPRIYLAAGVTTARTAGSTQPYSDLGLKRLIDSGKLIGPEFFLTAPHIFGTYSDAAPLFYFPQDVSSLERMVTYWADEGFTSFKLYTGVTREEMATTINLAHKRHLKVIGHLCAVTLSEAAQMGIDSLEHGLFASTDFVPDKIFDQCPSNGTLDQPDLDVESPKIQGLLQLLINKKVSLTSTTAILESILMAKTYSIDPRTLEFLSDELKKDVLIGKRIAAGKATAFSEKKFQRIMRFEYAFAKAGGHLMMGSDPTGYGALLAGFGDQRQIELLVEAGFTSSEAIQIASLNGAKHLGVSDRIGSLEPGKQADIVVVQGDLERQISNIRNVKWVFKNGIGYDSEKILNPLKGKTGVF